MATRNRVVLFIPVLFALASCRFLTVKECEKDSDCTGYNQCNTDTWRCFLPPLPEEVVESGFKMEQHAFSFPNFSGRDPDSTMTADLMQRMFGKSAVCAAEAGTCRVKPGPKEFQRLINLALQGGRCEGFAIFADLLFQGEMSPADFGAQNAAGIVIDNLDVKEELAYWFASQYLFDVVTDTTRSLDAEGLVRVLAAEFAKPQHPMYRLGISRIGNDGKRTGGHAVVPIAVVPKGEDRFVIKVYDNNHPGHEREMLVDVGAGTWEYQASANPDSQTSRYVGNPDNGNLVYLAEAPPRMGRHPCAFCVGSTEEAKHIFASGGTSLNATDEAGNRSGEVDGKLVSAIPGSVVTPVFSAETFEDRTDMQMVLPAGDSMKLSMRSAGSEGDGQEDSIRVFGPGTVIGVSNMGLEEGEEATLTWDKESDDVTYTPASPSGATITVSTTTSDGKEVSVSVTLPEDKDTDSVTMDVEEESGNPSVKVDSGTNEDTTVTMNVVRSDAESEDSLEASVDVPEDGSAEVDVENWEGDGHPAAVEVDNTGDGVPDQTVVVDDTGPVGTPPPAPSNLVATAISNALIRLTWTDNANNEDEIQIERDSGSGFVALTSLPANTVSYDDTAVQINSSYVYRVRASNPYGQSDYTTPAEAITPGCGPGLQDNDGDKVCQEACAVDTTCNGHGTCSDASGAVVCTCATEYSGARCDACATGYQDNDSNGTCTVACTSTMCGTHGTCSDTTGTATCTCETGWGGPECGGCAAGYQDNDVNHTCTPDCTQWSCQGHGTCADTTGTAVCACSQEYTGPHCESCAQGYQDLDGDGICTQEPPVCSTETCGPHGSCNSNPTPGNICICLTGYAGLHCETCATGYQDNDNDTICTPNCDGWDCSGRGVCSDATGTATCTCEIGYAPPDCSTCAQGYQDDDQDGICMTVCNTASCNGHGTCDGSTGVEVCTCEVGYAQPDCKGCAVGYQDRNLDGICLPDCSTETCNGRGTCDDSSGAALCACQGMWSGAQCEVCPPPAMETGGFCVGPTCAAIKGAFPGSTSGLYDIMPTGTPRRVYCDMDTDGGGWTLVSKFTQANGSFGSMDQATYDNVMRDAQWIMAGTTAPTSPDPDYSQRAIESIPWSEMLVGTGNFQLRQTFFVLDKQELMDVAYAFTFNGHLLQDTAPESERSWVLRSRQVFVDTTGIAWDPSDTPARFWMPFTPAVTGSVYTGCNAFDFTPDGCGKANPGSQRYGNAGIIGASIDFTDQAASWAPHAFPGDDLVRVENAAAQYGQSGRNMVLMYWLREVSSCASPLIACGADCQDGGGLALCSCAPGFTGPTCETNIDDCAANPCQNGGTCVDGINTYSCTCSGLWSGSQCEVCLPPGVQDGNMCLASTCRAIKNALPASASGVYQIKPGASVRSVYCDMDTDGGGWMLASKFTQAGGPFGLDPVGLYDTTMRMAQWMVDGTSPPTSPDPQYMMASVESLPWAENLKINGVHQLRQTFYVLDQQEMMDVAYTFTFNGHVIQDSAVGAARAWELRNRTVFTDSTGISWDPTDTPARFFLPFTASITGEVYTACNGFEYSTSGCSMSTPGTNRWGNAGIIGASADLTDQAGAWAPHMHNGDVVYINHATAQYGGSGRNMVLMYWLREASSCTDPVVNCGTGTCDDSTGVATCTCPFNRDGPQCERCAYGFTGPDCTEPISKSVSSGWSHACALVADGVKCWGSNSLGALGVPDQPLASAAPTLNLGSVAPVQLSSGNQFNCVLLADKTVKCWGSNSNAQARGVAGADVPAGATDPVPAALDVGGPVKWVGAGSYHACVLREDGGVRCWGFNQYGRCGLGHANTPVELTASVDVELGEAAAQLCVGSNHSCALTVSGKVYCWGDNNVGSMGRGDMLSVGDDESVLSAGPIPALTVAEIGAGRRVQAVSCSNSQTCVILDDGNARCFGENAEGELGYGTTATIGDDELGNTAGYVPVGGKVTQVVLGDHFTCMLMENGTAKCWGWTGRVLGSCLGHGADCGGASPPASTINVGAGVTILEMGSRSVSAVICARLSDNGVKCWYANGGNACGLNTATNPIDPPSATYTLPPSVCGNTTLEYGEQCDDGNSVAGDECNNQCQINSYADLCWPDAMGGTAQCPGVCSAVGRNWSGQWNCSPSMYPWCTSECVCGCQLP